MEQPGPEALGEPIGKPRSVGLTILVAIVTFGIWTWVWSFMNGEELKNYRHNGGRLSSAYHRPLFWSDEYRAMKGRSPWSW
jgi:hypothetical protein